MTASAPVQATMTVGGIRALTITIRTPWRGVWTAECDLDPAAGSALPSGKVTIQIGQSITLAGTVDANRTGRFVAAVRVYVVGGAGGWSLPAQKQFFASDGGVLSSTVYTSTAGPIGETVEDPDPVTFTAAFERTGGPSSQVFGDRDWYVDPSGVTWVQSRPVASPDPSVFVLGYSASEQRAEVTADALILPGTQLTDARFDGTKTVVDVEQTFSRVGSRAVLLFSGGGSTRLISALITLIRQSMRFDYVQTYAYRVVDVQGSGPTARLNLQAVQTSGVMPDALPVSIQVANGVYATPAPATIVRVAFLNADPSMPLVVGFDNSTPTANTIDASNSVDIGPSATGPVTLGKKASSVTIGQSSTTVSIAGGAEPLVRATTDYAALLNVLTSLASSLATVTTIAQVASAGTAFGLGLTLLPNPPGTKKIKGT